MREAFQRDCHVPHELSSLEKMLLRPSFDIEQDFPGDELHDAYDVRSLTVTDAMIYDCSQLSVPSGRLDGC